MQSWDETITYAKAEYTARLSVAFLLTVVLFFGSYTRYFVSSSMLWSIFVVWFYMHRYKRNQTIRSAKGRERNQTREQKEGTRTYHCCIQTTQHGRPVFTSRGAQHLIPLVHIFPKDMALAHEVWLMIDHACSPSYVRHVGRWCPDENCLMMRVKIMKNTSLL